MPKKEPSMSYTLLRNYTEKFTWTDAHGARCTGYNPPENAKNVERVPFFIKFVTAGGKIESGMVTCVSAVPQRHQRKIRFVNSGEIRVCYDFLILEVDGTHFISH
jgi:ribosomal protein S18